MVPRRKILEEKGFREKDPRRKKSWEECPGRSVLGGASREECPRSGVLLGTVS
jgi:hypothetical protein